MGACVHPVFQKVIHIFRNIKRFVPEHHKPLRNTGLKQDYDEYSAYVRR